MIKKTRTLSGYNLAVLSPYDVDEAGMNRSYNPQMTGKERDLNQDLVLCRFKVYPCDIKTQHNHKQCRFFHSNKDRRRMQMPVFSDLCPVAQKHINDENYQFVCPRDQGCDRCHNKVEQLYCVQKYKTKFCTHYPDDCSNCQYGMLCSFAHRENEIRMELIHHYQPDTDFFIFHYKTLWCPFNYIKHDRSQCYYAHNWQDYRRRPSEYSYEPMSCGNWNPNNFIAKYRQECKFEMNCNKCHGWKELEYHPLNYKTRQCSNGVKCPKGNICPYYHRAPQKRKLPEKIKNGEFAYHPRNRKIGQQTGMGGKTKSPLDCRTAVRTNSNPTYDTEKFSQSSDGSVNEDKDQNENNQEIEEMVKRLIDE